MLHVGNIVYPGFDIMTLSALSVFEYANKNLDQPHYDVRLVPESGGPIRSSLGLIVQTEPFDVTPFDTIIIGGSSDMPSSPGLLDYLGRAASDCRRAITHWFFADEFRSRYARVRLEESRLFVIDGPCCTSAGMTARIDLVLTMVENDSGPHVVSAVSRNPVLYSRRNGGQPQIAALLDLGPTTDRIHTALAHARANLPQPPGMEQLAQAAHLSPRLFSRAFRKKTGTSPATAVEKLRIEATQLLVQDGRYPIEVVARQTGFGESQRMRRALLRGFGRSPQVMRRERAMRSTAPAPDRTRAGSPGRITPL